MFTMNTDVIKRWYKKTKKNLVLGFGGKCCVCGYNKCQEAFDFHHIDPSNKEFNICAFKIKNREKIYNEAKKCVMLCSNCHREFHANLITIDTPIYFDESKIPIEVESIKMKSCEACGTQTKNSKFCCSKCSSDYHSKSKLSNELLLELVKTKTYTEIGNMYSVTEAAIRKRHKKLKHGHMAQLDSASLF